MAEAQEVRVRLALVGPTGSGKTAALEYLHRTTPPDQRGPLVQLVDRTGRTLLYDHVELQYGRVGDLPLFVDVYSLPGSPWAVLARRIVLTGCNGFIYVTDGRDSALADAHAGFIELCEFLAERGRTPETAALVVALSRKDLTRGAPTAVEAALAEHVGDRLLHISTRTGEGVTEAVRKATALALSRERDELEARRQGAPPPRAYVPPALEEEVELAHELYLRGAGKFGAFSPHSDPYLGEILLELGAVTEADLDEALRLRAEAFKLALGVSLEEILTKRGMIDPELIPRARMLRACVEVIHEEITFGKLATELEAVPFARVKQALGLQAKRQFHNSLDHLLTRAGQLDRAARQRVLCRLLQVHQGELLRDEQPGEAGAVDTPTFDTKAFRALPLFGEVAIGLGLVTQEQLREALEEQRRLKAKGRRRFVGSILQQRGHLTEDDVRRICRALEEKIADDRIQGYEIICPLGRGNMALVFAATQVNLNRVVALKILDPKLLVDQEFVERFLREAQAAARLNHPNIVQAYDVGSSQDLHYFAMEYVDGITARELLERAPGQRLEQETAIDVVVQVARALDHAGRHHLVHRDVKPGNVMINREGVVKLCDLGLATTLDAEGPTESAMILGSPYYISPEQIEGRPDLDTRADIYSLGAMLFHLVTGRPPFTGRTPEDVCLKHLSEPVPDPTDLSPTVTQTLVPVMFRMMAKDRNQRYSSCTEVVRALLERFPAAASDERQDLLARQIQTGFPSRKLSKKR
ncbi:MAG: protein kinase [Planctomycetes bacterium]|nr:protein kinase [Planctomycetota bacterium]